MPAIDLTMTSPLSELGTTPETVYDPESSSGKLPPDHDVCAIILITSL